MRLYTSWIYKQQQTTDKDIFVEKDHNKEAVLKDLLECHSGDIEGDHSKADDALCLFLTRLGYQDVVDAYNSVEKWYA
jgi:hypothetical protein